MLSEKSAGAVIFRKEGGDIYYLLLHYAGSRPGAKGYWDFPKGHLEGKETEEQAAQRETKEETGIKNIAFIQGFKKSIKYFFRAEGKIIFKKVVFFLAETQKKEIKISEEHIGYKWLPFKEAFSSIKFANAKNILTEANDFLEKNEKKGILLFSGGLDSLLAYKILKKQGLEVLPVCFESCFFNCEQARKTAFKNRFEIKIIDISKEQLETVKNPKHGRGKNLNPCIDCHLLMLKKAKELMEKEKACFVSTGEVLGQRPFSQNIKAFQKMEKTAGLEGMILRPLSSKILPETLAENQGIAKRKNFFDFQGKSRKGQLDLAKKFDIKYFPQPAGGCLLTDRIFSDKLKELLKRHPKFSCFDAKILNNGRIFFENNFFAVLARNQKEGEILISLKKGGDLLFEPKNFAGPTILIRFFGSKSGNAKKMVFEKAKRWILQYSKKEKLPALPEIKEIRKKL